MQKEVDFVLVYITEAHPKDGWAYRSNPYSILTHENLEGRLAAAQILVSEQLPAECTLVADTMSNLASEKYSAHPERLYVVEDGLITYASAWGPRAYSVAEVEKRLLARGNSEFK